MKLRRGFTLIEILIVMVIILILAGILYPVFAAVRSKTQQVKCATQMKQIGMAIQMYASDHDDFPPMGWYQTRFLPPGFVLPGQPPVTSENEGKQTWRVTWSDELVNAADLKDYRVLVCPTSLATDYRYSYGANHWIMGWQTQSWPGVMRLDAIDTPARTVLLTEKRGYDWVAWQPSEALNNPYYVPLEARHLNNQLNVLFCDGHVGHVAAGELIEGPSIIWRPQ